LILIAISWFIFLWFQPQPTAGGHFRHWRNPWAHTLRLLGWRRRCYAWAEG
jgi:hypothetical protein